MERSGSTAGVPHRVTTTSRQALRPSREDDRPCPRIIRPAFTLGGTGGGIAYNREEFDDHRQARPRRQPGQRGPDRRIAARLEGIRAGGRCATRPTTSSSSARIENLDPMGVHTGDSHHRRAGPDPHRQGIPASCATPSIAVIREIGVETGGCNIQFAVNPANGDMVVIEMNPRVSPLLGPGLQGHRLPDRQDRRQAWPSATPSTKSATTSPGKTPACFEPTIDYVVVKIPRFAFEKFPGRPTHAHHLR
jgi:carbamoyl-phosphate synthase large subunit